MLADPTGRFVSQREHPALARWRAELSTEGLRLELPSGAVLEVPMPEPSAPRRDAKVWGDAVRARGVASSIDEALSSSLGVAVQLLYLPDEELRTVDQAYAPEGERVGLADGFPYLLVNQASVDAIAREPGGEASALGRYRPNLVLAGAEPWAEDHWRRVRVGSLVFSLVKPCQRCSVLEVDPTTGERAPGVLGAVARAHSQGHKALFGQNALVHGEGWLEVGASAEVLE